jgi:CelD/BcsL family acetyltransferase involved in cellulose biosynthesis
MLNRVDVSKDTAVFARMRDEWTELLHSSAVDCPFLTWEWLHAWWTHLAERRRLYIVAVRSKGELIAIAPLVSRGMPPFSRLEFLGTGFAGSDYLDVILRSGRETEGLDALADYFRSLKTPLWFDHVLTPGAWVENLTQRLAHDRWSPTTRALGTCPFITLEGHSWDSLLGTLGSSHRYNVRRRIRNITSAFEMTFEPVQIEKDRPLALEALIRLHNARWRDRGGSTAFHTGAMCAFHDQATRLALECGWLRLYVLKLNGDVAAVQYLFGYRDRFYFYQHGYDARYSQQSVGLVSFALAIRAAIDERADEFDMLWGDESYKDLWAHGARNLVRIETFPPDVRGVLHRRAIGANLTLRALAKRMLRSAESSADAK